MCNPGPQNGIYPQIVIVKSASITKDKSSHVENWEQSNILDIANLLNSHSTIECKTKYFDNALNSN